MCHDVTINPNVLNAKPVKNTDSHAITRPAKSPSGLGICISYRSKGIWVIIKDFLACCRAKTIFALGVQINKSRA